MPAKYVLAHKPRKGYHWNLVASNGRVVATSEHYETKRAALAGIASVQKNGATTVIVDAAVEAAKEAAKTPARKAATASSSSASAKKTTAKKPVTKATTPPASTADVRAWALANGHSVSNRGRIPAHVQAAYRSAHS